MAIRHSCPFCDRDSILLPNVSFMRNDAVFTDMDEQTKAGVISIFKLCPNEACRRFTLTVHANEARKDSNAKWQWKPLGFWQLVPRSAAKAHPDYIPEVIRKNYEEACLIVDASPKASATLARRCLQGMIRDFWGVSKETLWHEIEALKDKVDPLVWNAMVAVRKIGNIGAHMEKDVNLIIDVDPDEAAKLIWLIELLMREWYIYRHVREQGLKELAALPDAKKATATISEPPQAEG